VKFSKDALRRGTGLYLSPGSIGHVVVPTQLVGVGFQVLVGAHTHDHSKKKIYKRLHRVSKTFEIVAEETYITNPLGGGIYLQVPYGATLDLVEISIDGVLEAPRFSHRSFDQMSAQEWNRRQKLEAPWADFESDKFMMQVPRSFIYRKAYPLQLMKDWDRAMDGYSEYLGIPPERRNRQVLYIQPDLQLRGSSFGIGYPQQVNNLANSKHIASDNGDKNVWYLNNMTDGEKSLEQHVWSHELGHASAMSMFPGEKEAIVNFPLSYILNAKFGVDFSLAFSMTLTKPIIPPDEAAITWMVSPNFRAGKPMGENEMRYQHRGYAKYGDVRRLFGWEALLSFHKKEHEDYLDGKLIDGRGPSHGLDRVSSRILRMSVAAKADLTPLIHFWGVKLAVGVPDGMKLKKGSKRSPTLASRLQEFQIPKSKKIKDLLQRYKQIAPKNNAEFNAHYLRIYPKQPQGGHLNSGHGFYNQWKGRYNDEHGRQAVAFIDSLLQLYFPEDF